MYYSYIANIILNTRSLFYLDNILLTNINIIHPIFSQNYEFYLCKYKHIYKEKQKHKEDHLQIVGVTALSCRIQSIFFATCSMLGLCCE